MSLEQSRKGLEEAGRSDLAGIVEGVMEAFGGDIPFLQGVEEVSPYEQILKEYREQRPTPELVSAFFKAFWEDKASKAGIEITVRPFERTQKELRRHEENGNMVVYIPPEVARDRALLTKLFSGYTDHYALSYNYHIYKDNTVHEGYIFTEKSIKPPHTGTNEDELGEEFEKRERRGLTITEYFIAGQVSKEVTGEYLDQNGCFVRLLGSSEGGKVVNALFDLSGRFNVDSHLNPQYRHDSLGGRSISGVN